MPNKIYSIAKIIAYIFLFVTQSVFAQQYAYDSNGNLASDNNKQIASIHYNHLNLVDTLSYTDGRKIIYTYTALGQKLGEQSIAANGTIVKKRDYVDHYLYANDSLREIQYEEGRAVPVVGGNSSSAMEYQYHIKDHLGNVRTTLTSRRDVDNSTATFETASMALEHNRFLRYDDAKRINSVWFDHTRSGGDAHYSQRLNGTANEIYGLAKSLSVMPGDTIKLEVFAKYVDPNVADWTTTLANLLAQIASNTAGVVVDGVSYNASTTSFPVFGSVPGKSTDTGGPKAYLNWLVFDRDFILRDAGYTQMTDAGKENGQGEGVEHERLFKQLVIGTPGYVYAYLSNEGPTPVEVYFDDFTVTQVKGPVIQQTDYDPFGLTFNEYSRENSVSNNFLYNGKELQKDFDLNWYDYGARMYDAALGRWHVIDPMADKYKEWSPYIYVMNNPLKFIDPDGQDAEYVTPMPAGVRKLIEKMPSGKGTEIMKGLAKNHKIKVLIAYQPRSKFKTVSKDGEPAVGITGRLDPNDMEKVPKTGRTHIKKETSGLSEFHVFAGKDITADVKSGRTIYVVSIALGPDGEMAESTLHEFAAHANPDREAVKTEMEKCHCSEDDAEHNVYGANAVARFEINERGQIVAIPGDENMPVNSLADQIQQDIVKVLQRQSRR